MKIDGANLLDGITGGGKQDEIKYGTVSVGNHAAAGVQVQTEKLSKGEQAAEVIYQKPQQEKKSGTTQEVMQQAENMNTEQMKDKMVVASHTTTPSDCKKMEDDGFSLHQTDIETVVTVTDKIKMELAKAGIDVSYFTDGFSAEQLEKMTGGNAAMAQELAAKMQEADLPLTAENVNECIEAMHEVQELHALNDGALKYMLDNGLEPTIENLYKAQYCGSSMYMNPNAGPADFTGMEEQISKIITQAGKEENDETIADSRWLIQNQIPLTAENLNELENLKTLEFPKEMEDVLDAMVTAMAEGNRPKDAALLEGYSLADQAQHAADVVHQASEEDIAYIINQGHQVTIDQLEWAHAKSDNLNAQEKEEIINLVQGTKNADTAEQSPNGDVQAFDTVSASDNVSAETAAEAADENVPGTDGSSGDIPMTAQTTEDQRALVQKTDVDESENGTSSGQTPQINLAADAGSSGGAMQNENGDFSHAPHSQYNNMQLSFITARRQLEEVRMMMTQEAAYSMLKQGISVNTSSIEELIDHLKELENGFYRDLLTQGGIEATEANVSLFAETSEKLEQLKDMPAYALGTWNIETATLEELHQSGSEMQQNFQQAQERYETMQTEVRKDLGDSIQKAFQNVDDILQSLDLDASAANERAVRILGYNSIEITHESIMRMKAADQQVQRAFQNLTPAVVREFVARGINPLDMDVVQLNEQAEQIREELHMDEPEEKYSEYLFKLEQNKNISEEERSSYIGIYRLMNQVVQSDGAAVGALVHQGAQITMRNLLAAVRSERHGGIDISVDNSFGELQSGGYEDSITDQIEAGYQNHCLKQALDELSPERFRTVLNETDPTGKTQWEDMTPEQFLQQLQEAPEDMAAEEAYYQQKLEDLAQCTQASKEVYQVLEQYDLPHTMMNVLAVSELMANRNGAYRRFFQADNGRRPDSNISTEQYMSKNPDSSVEVDFDAVKAELLEQFSEDAKRPEELAKAMAELAECAEKCMSTMIIEPDISSMDIRELKLMNAQISVSSKMASSECFSMPIVIDGEVTNVTLKVVRGREQKGLVNITLETGRFGKIAAEIKAKQEGISGYVAADTRQTRDYLQSKEEEIKQALQQDSVDSEIDLHFVTSDRLDLNYFASKSGSSEEPESEEVREMQTKTLYGMAEGFIRILRQIEAA